MIVLAGLILAALAFPDVRTALWMRSVAKQYPSVSIRAYNVAMQVIALVGVGFAIIGLNSSVALLFTDRRTILPVGAGILLLLGIAFILKVPGAYLRDQVKRLVAQAEAGETEPDADPRVPR
jgi:hypothetical protein